MPIAKVFSLCCMLCVLAAAAARAQSAPGKDGLFLTVSHPIDDKVVAQVKRKVENAVVRQKRAIHAVVFDFTPQDAPAGTTSFGLCSDLAEYIRQLRLGQIHPGFQPRTIAFLTHEVSDHTVLPVLACGEIVMGNEPAERGGTKARLGNVTAHLAGRRLTDLQREAYLQLAKEHRGGDLVRRMLDPQLPLSRVVTENSTRFLASDTIASLRANQVALVVQSEVPAGLELGVASFDAEQARSFGLCQQFANSRAALCRQLDLSPQALNEDWLVGRTVVPWRIDVRGALDPGRIESLRRRVKQAVARGANLLILQLSSGDGDTSAATALAYELRQLRDKSDSYPVRTVAYVPPRVTLSATSFLALSCNEILMGSGAVLMDLNALNDELLPRRREGMRDLILQQGFDEELLEAAMTPKTSVVRVRASQEPTFGRFVTEAAFARDQAGPRRWQSHGTLSPQAGELLAIDGPLALEAKLATAIDVDTPEAVYKHLFLEPDAVRVSRDDLLDRVAEFFREPLVNYVLILLGVLGMILEFKLPGTTFPGAVAAICFVLFFWAYSFVGEFTVLAILLFLLGLILIAVEIFVVPGLGFSGVAGVVLLVTSLLLVTMDRWPETSQDWSQLRTMLTTVSLSLATAIGGGLVLIWYLPSVPYFNGLMLNPPDDSGPEDEPALAGAVPMSMLGAMGVAATPLRPAGKVQFGDEFLDVVAEGDFVQPGQQVRIIEIEGNRIVVKEI